MIKMRAFAGVLLGCFVASCQTGSEKPLSATFDTDYAELIPSGEIAATDGVVAVDASVYRGLMQMLGIGERCADFSTEQKPDAERVAMARPQMFLLSAYDGNDCSKYERLGLRVVECRDFLEQSPLARAEWMRYFGRLWNVGERADSLFRHVEREYNSLRIASSHSNGTPSASTPKVFFDLLYGNLWYQPAQESTIGRMISDAGGAMPFGDGQKGGALALSAEQVLMKAREAEVWIIRYAAAHELTLAELSSLNPVYSQFRAFKTGNVFVCNTQKIAYHDETPFRPDLLIADFRAMLHPELGEKTLRYFKRIKEK